MVVDPEVWSCMDYLGSGLKREAIKSEEGRIGTTKELTLSVVVNEPLVEERRLRQSISVSTSYCSSALLSQGLKLPVAHFSAPESSCLRKI